MAAATTYGSLATSSTSGIPVDSRPRRNPHFNYDSAVVTLATTRIDDIGDITGFIPVPSGARLLFLDLGESTDMDTGGSPALDMDVVLLTVIGGVTASSTVLFDGGTWYLGAQATGRRKIITAQTQVPNTDSGWAWIALKVVAAAATAAQGTAELGVGYTNG